MKRVGSIGPKNAKIVLVGEAPGEEEELQGIPFVGPAGKFLNMLLEKAGILRQDCYLTNVVKIRPPDNKIHRLKELGTDLESFYPELHAELRSCTEARVIVPLGDVALTAIEGYSGITRYRGSIIGAKEPYIVPTLHPSYIRRFGYGMSRAVVQDLIKARRIASEGFTRTERNYKVCSNVQELTDYCKLIRTESKVFVYDIEYLRGTISCIGIGISPTNALVIPFKYNLDNIWTQEVENQLWQELMLLFNDPTILKIGQNAFRFDVFVLERIFGGFPAPPWYDTLLAHSLIMPEMPHDLAFLTSIYTDIPYYKDDTKDIDGKKFKCSPEELWSYNAKDCWSTFEVATKTMQELNNLNMHEFMAGYVTPLFRVLAEVSLRGLLVDKEERDRFQLHYEQEAYTIQQRLNTSVGYNLNVRSFKQVSKLIYSTLKMPPRYDRKTGNLTTGADALEELYAETGNDILRDIIALRSLGVMLSSFVDSGLDSDGRIRTSFGTTETGRLSSKKTIWKTGANMQNNPPEYKSVFITSPETVFISGDLSQAEARDVSAESGCTTLQSWFNSGADVFRYIGSKVFNKPPEEVTDEERTEMKRVVHGSNYQMGITLFAANIGKPRKEAKVIQDQYFKLFPEIRSWHRKIEDSINRTSKLTTVYGRVRIFLGRFDKTTYKEATAFGPQSTIADCMNQGILKLHYLLPYGAYVVMQVHDEILIECALPLTNEVIELLKQVYSKPIAYNPPLRVPIKIKIGKSWWGMEEVA